MTSWRSALRLSLALALAASACSRKDPVPLLNSPAAGVTSASMAFRSVDISAPPNIKAILQVIGTGSTPLVDFKLGNFSVLEDGTPAVPLEVGPEVDPVISVGIVLDRSGTMQGANTDYANAGATALVNALTGNDRASLIEFESSARVVVPMTGDKATLLAEINTPAEGGSTAYFDGVVFAADQLSKESGIKILIFLSDGDPDNSSTNTQASMVNAVAGLGIVVYGIVVGPFPTDTAQYSAISTPTGGTLYFSPSGTGLDAIFLAILDSALFKNLCYVKFRGRTLAEKYTVYLNYGNITASAETRIKR